jgi:hypothetical protein
MHFFLGAHHPEWLAKTDVPLCVSVRAIRSRIFVPGRKRRAPVPRALAPWLCDSAGFTEVSEHGRWRTTPREHAELVQRAADEIGNIAWASPQDWMCEPWVVKGGTVIVHGRRVTFPGTGLTVRDHQRRTVDSVLELRALAPGVHWTPVLQGWALGEYLDCIELYDKAGLDLREEPIVGLGSVCRRQGMLGANLTIAELAGMGLRLHGFGFKVDGLRAVGHLLASADSMAWSSGARYAPPIPGHTHARCNNCIEHALDWRADLLGRLGGHDCPHGD